MPDWYTGGAAPATGSFGASNVMRAQFTGIAESFGKMPTLTGNGGFMVRVNAAGTALESIAMAVGADVTAGTDEDKAITPKALADGEVNARSITSDTVGGPVRVDLLTQVEYDAIVTKDPDTLYFIVG
jgi:hypothetical protein